MRNDDEQQEIKINEINKERKKGEQSKNMLKQKKCIERNKEGRKKKKCYIGKKVRRGRRKELKGGLKK